MIVSTQALSKNIEDSLKVLSNNEIQCGNDVLEDLLKRNIDLSISLKRKSSDSSNLILESIKKWISKKLCNIRRKEEKD